MSKLDVNKIEKELNDEYGLHGNDAREMAMIIAGVIDYSERGRYYKNGRELCQMCVEESPGYEESERLVISVKPRSTATAEEINKSESVADILERKGLGNYNNGAKKLDLVWTSRMKKTKRKRVGKATWVAVVNGSERHICEYHLEKLEAENKVDNDKMWYTGGK